MSGVWLLTGLQAVLVGCHLYFAFKSAVGTFERVVMVIWGVFAFTVFVGGMFVISTLALGGME